MTPERIEFPAWAQDFDNSPRHCWPLKDGTLQLTSGDWVNPSTCDGDHNPRLTGTVEWMRFIHCFGSLNTENPFTDESEYVLLNETDGHRTSDGRHTYCESYLRKNQSDWGVKPVFRVFLDNVHSWARIECYDWEMVGNCEQALSAVEKSYALP